MRNDDIKLGRFNVLRVTKAVDFGLYLDGGDTHGEILLPTRYVPEGVNVGDEISVFIYLDQEERLIATTETPLAQMGDFAFLEVAWVNNYGAFLHWGPMKDLFVPFREQKIKMMKGESYIVHVHMDEQSYRLMASAKVERYLCQDFPPYRPGNEVDILIWYKTDIGVKVIVNNKFGGMLFDTQIFKELHIGDRMKAYIKRVRPDGKIDLTLQKKGKAGVRDFADILQEYMEDHGGVCTLCDKSPADEIYRTFGVSKKIFKKGIGDLYKRRLIEIGENCLILIRALD